MFAIVERGDAQVLSLAHAYDHVALMMPILQLVIMGNALRRQDRGPAVSRSSIMTTARNPVKIREAFDSIAVNIKTFTTVDYTSEVQAREDVRTGRSMPPSSFPPNISRRVYAQDAPVIGLVVDNTDPFSSSSIEGEMQLVVTALTTPVIQPRLASQIALRSSSFTPTSTT